MTKDDIIEFYKENKQNAPLNELGKEILEAVRMAYLARVLTEDPSANPDIDFEVQSLYNSSIETLRLCEDAYYHQLNIITLRGTYFFVLEELIVPEDELGESQISWKMKRLEDSMNDLILQIGQIQEKADRIKQKWNAIKKSRVERKA